MKKLLHGKEHFLQKKANLLRWYRLPKTRALKIILFKHYTTDAPI
jgi:hypothetical protein